MFKIAKDEENLKKEEKETETSFLQKKFNLLTIQQTDLEKKISQLINQLENVKKEKEKVQNLLNSNLESPESNHSSLFQSTILKSESINKKIEKKKNLILEFEKYDKLVKDFQSSLVFPTKKVLETSKILFFFPNQFSHLPF